MDQPTDIPSPERLHELLDTIGRFKSPDWQTHLAAMAEIERAGQHALPVIKQRLADANARVRRFCAGFFDHFAENECEAGILRALGDGNADVRRIALHSLSCQRCKPHPLTFDITALLLDRALADPSLRVRRVALSYLHGRSPDPRIVAGMERILAEATDRCLRRRAQGVLDDQCQRTGHDGTPDG